MERRSKWMVVAALGLSVAGCLGEGAQEVGARSSALTLDDVASRSDAQSIAEELAAEDCVQAGRTAEGLGHEVVWATVDAFADTALLEIDGLVACSAPTVSLSPNERVHVVRLVANRQVRPDPEPANPRASRPDPEPASPDEARPDPEPASPDEARPDPEPATPDENRPDPEPATGGGSSSQQQ